MVTGWDVVVTSAPEIEGGKRVTSGAIGCKGECGDLLTVDGGMLRLKDEGP